MSQGGEHLSVYERVLSLFSKIRPGEARCVTIFFLQGFLLLFSYSVVKALREALILSEHKAEIRAYAVALIALILMFLVPAYSAVRRYIDGIRLIQAVMVLFLVTLIMFLFLVQAGTDVGFIFFVWASIYGVGVISQFWAFAADTFNLKSGQRLFPVIMIGGNLGGLAGAESASLAIAHVQPTGLMVMATMALFITIFMAKPARRAVPDGSRSVPVADHEAPAQKIFGGFSLVLNDRYLRLVALLVVLLNLVNTTGEFVLSDVVQRHFDALIASGQTTLDKKILIGQFYGNYQFLVNLCSLLIQMLLVSRIYRFFGVRGALMVLPIVAAFGYGLIVFLPIFSIIQVVKILENSVDYSLMNTTRQALFLPVSRAAKYEGKTTIETFFWRFGDLLQAGFVYAGTHWLAFGTAQFATLNLALALGWIGLAYVVGREFKRQAMENPTNVAPELNRPIPDFHWTPGTALVHSFPEDTFIDSDPGDVLVYRAQLRGGGELPKWLRFDARRRHFYGEPPGHFEEIHVEVMAADVDGFEVSSVFVMRCVAHGSRSSTG